MNAWDVSESNCWEESDVGSGVWSLTSSENSGNSLCVSEIQLPRAEISWLKIKMDLKVICECLAVHQCKQLLFLAISVPLVLKNRGSLWMAYTVGR